MSIPFQPQTGVVQASRRFDRQALRNKRLPLSSERQIVVDKTPDHDEKPDDLVAAWSILQLYGTNPLAAGSDVGTLSVQTLPERLAAILLRMSTNQGGGAISGVSMTALAEQLGTHKETAGAILRAFKRQGLVEFGYRCIRIVDEESLRDLSDIPNGIY